MALLRACPDLRVLATSREGLRVTGEQQYRVPSLSVPDPSAQPAVELVPAYEAVRLFVARAQERQAGFALTAQIAPVVATICARLDGIPLAIELAAARVGMLTVEAIAARLDDRFRLLIGGPRDLPTRQQTLRATLDWSWTLLTVPEQTLLWRLSVFVDGWTLEGAEAVCADADLDAGEVLNLLDGLVSKSLVQIGHAGGRARYSLLETIRQYAAAQFDGAGEHAALRDRHLSWCVTLALN